MTKLVVVGLEKSQAIIVHLRKSQFTIYIHVAKYQNSMYTRGSNQVPGCLSVKVDVSYLIVITFE